MGTIKTVNDGGPAFPVQEDDVLRGDPGMSLRDWFATHAPAMPDQWASYRREEVFGAPEKEDANELKLMAAWRWAWADMMIAARFANI